LALTAPRQGALPRISIPAALAGAAGIAVALPLVGVVFAALGRENADIAGRNVMRYAATSA
jgi:hypothetical protein